MSSDIKTELLAIYTKLTRAHSGDSVDPALVQEVYTQDARIMAPGKPVATGINAAIEMIKAVHGSGARRAQVDIEEVLQAGDWAVERSRFTLATADGNTVESGKQLMVWKKVSGQWKIYVDCWNDGQ